MQEFNEFLRLIRISSFFIFFCPRLINAARMTTASVPLPCDAAGEHYAAITSERPFRWPLVLERSLIAEFNVRGQCAIFIGASSRDRGSAARTRYREKSRTRASAPMMTIPSIIPMMTRVSRGNRSSSSRGGGGGGEDGLTVAAVFSAGEIARKSVRFFARIVMPPHLHRQPSVSLLIATNDSSPC